MANGRDKKKLFQQREDLLHDIHTVNVNVPSREVYLHGYYQESEEPGVEYRMATTFIKNLHHLERQSNDPIVIHMHTIGGEWNDGIAIYEAIKVSPCPKASIAYAHAQSMSSVIPQAADKRVIMPTADFMIHYGSISVDEISTSAKSTIDWNERANKKMLQIYLERCKETDYFSEMSDRQILNFLDKKMRYFTDWWITADESVEYGFMDGIMGEKGFETIEKIKKSVKKRK